MGEDLRRLEEAEQVSSPEEIDGMISPCSCRLQSCLTFYMQRIINALDGAAAVMLELERGGVEVGTRTLEVLQNLEVSTGFPHVAPTMVS